MPRPCSVGAGRLKGLEKGEPLGIHADLVHQGNEPGRRVAVECHPVVVGEFSEHGRPGFADIQGVLDQGVCIHIGFVDLALGPLVAEEPSLTRVMVVRSAT